MADRSKEYRDRHETFTLDVEPPCAITSQSARQVSDGMDPIPKPPPACRKSSESETGEVGSGASGSEVPSTDCHHTSVMTSEIQLPTRSCFSAATLSATLPAGVTVARMTLDHSVHVRIVGGELIYDDTPAEFVIEAVTKRPLAASRRQSFSVCGRPAECGNAEKRRRFSMAQCEWRGLRSSASTATE